MQTVREKIEILTMAKGFRTLETGVIAGKPYADMVCKFVPGAELFRLEMGKHGRWETETYMGKIIAVEGDWSDLRG